VRKVDRLCSWSMTMWSDLLGGLKVWMGVVSVSISFERCWDSGLSARRQVRNRSWTIEAFVWCYLTAYSVRFGHPLSRLICIHQSVAVSLYTYCHEAVLPLNLR
jgi:hypothetical protein